MNFFVTFAAVVVFGMLNMSIVRELGWPLWAFHPFTIAFGSILYISSIWLRNRYFISNASEEQQALHMSKDHAEPNRTPPQWSRGTLFRSVARSVPAYTDRSKSFPITVRSRAAMRSNSSAGTCRMTSSLLFSISATTRCEPSSIFNLELARTFARRRATNASVTACALGVGAGGVAGTVEVDVSSSRRRLGTAEGGAVARATPCVIASLTFMASAL